MATLHPPQYRQARERGSCWHPLGRAGSCCGWQECPLGAMRGQVRQCSTYPSREEGAPEDHCRTGLRRTRESRNTE